jgi:hypothetical protein
MSLPAAQLAPVQTNPARTSPVQPARSRSARVRSALSARTRRRRATTATGLAGAVLALDVLTGAGAASAATTDEFRRLARCESGGNYGINTGNGYYGAYQFALGTWRSLGYSGYPHQAPAAVQDEAAAKLQARSGWGQWPACSRKLGLRSGRGLVDAPPPVPTSPIARHYAGNAEARGHLGAPKGPEFPVHGGAVRLYDRGQIVFSGATGARAVYGAIFDEYGRHRWEQGLLGYPVSDEHPIPGGRQNLFQRGVIAWSPETGARVLIGDVRKRYEALGGVSGPLGYPTSGERPEEGGVSQSFVGGEIFWDAGTRATTALAGEVLAAYRAAGGPAGELGMPLETSAGADGTSVAFEGGRISQAAGSRTASVLPG